jgi:hypothetical protein
MSDPRTATVYFSLIALLAAAIPSAVAQDSADKLTEVDRRVLRELTAEKAAGSLMLHYRPADLSAAQLETCLQANLRSFRELEKLLDMKYAGTIHIFLYRDTADLKQQTGSGAAAFSTGTVSVHQPIDFVSVHELCHIFALQFPRVAGGISDIFVVEGLATALAESDQNVPIHSWAAVYARARRLPDLWEFRWKWPEKTPPRVHPYHVAGSFVGFLVERYGIAKVKDWYVNATEAQSVFGRSFPELEREWREWLTKLPLDAAHEHHVLERLKLLDAKLPDELVHASGERLFDGSTLAGLEPEAAEKWQVRDGRLIGRNDAAWSAIRLRSKTAAAAVRVQFRLVSGDAFKITAESEAGPTQEIIFARWSGYLTCGDGYASGQDVKMIDSDVHTVVVTWKGGATNVYLDGLRVVQCEQGGPAGEVRLGVAVERGEVEVGEISVIKS